MSISEASKQIYGSVSTRQNDSILPLSGEPEVGMRKPQRKHIQRQTPDNNDIRMNRFFEGLLFVLPLSILSWVIILWGIGNMISWVVPL